MERMKLILAFKGKGGKENPSNYRIICMECTQFKLFLSIINESVSNYIDYTLPEEQFGFRKGRSTGDEVKKLLTTIEKNKTEHKPLYCVFADFTSAFNLTNRKQLLRKMNDNIHNFNKDGNVFHVIKEIHHSNILIVQSNQGDLKYTQNFGTPQGDCLRATNFIIDTADLLILLKDTGCEVAAYADDVAFYHFNPNIIRNTLTTLSRWNDENGMILNVGKTKV